ncbi:TPA: LysM-like peptidoglycan-binding domain-containing protein [Kluyvera cryocrescens]|uniref:OapA family protein n=1 Tax=Kluyvera cryocrescens TaxID=580 RepID=A0A2X3DP54_KLUCR|nr:OapA family protein [Kluyvera cryocrescens]MCX2868965.1 OapA family protein [Kluyvera cryocrescens]MDW3779269.1 OapA family protein [Kluyvera cryocrescens]MEB6635118.1 OapA family protein [Kluyvera cryocrescens]MEB7715061.1 OapA family protein [Kluyvera cryocrescens]WNN71349.1 OapA family protein [Kluyvera cryocrescens]
MPGRFEVKPLLEKLWHAPDNLRILDPLPLAHRRGVIIAALVVVIGFLLPSADDSPPTPVSRTAQLDFQSQSQPTPQPDSQPLHAQLVTPSNDLDQVAPVEPEPVQEEQPTEQAAPPRTQQPYQENRSSSEWRTYQVEAGKTLAQLFRDNNLPPTDVYAMAQVEGAGKPLSTLKNGQKVQIRKNANGVVTGLTIESDNGQVLFTRQADGSFIRAR